MTGDERYGYLPVGKSTALSEPCQEFGQGSLGVGRKRDKGQGDKETRGRGEDSPCLPLSLSPCPLVTLLVWRNYGLLSWEGDLRALAGCWLISTVHALVCV